MNYDGTASSNPSQYPESSSANAKQRSSDPLSAYSHISAELNPLDGFNDPSQSWGVASQELAGAQQPQQHNYRPSVPSYYSTSSAGGPGTASSSRTSSMYMDFQGTQPVSPGPPIPVDPSVDAKMNSQVGGNPGNASVSVDPPFRTPLNAPLSGPLGSGGASSRNQLQGGPQGGPQGAPQVGNGLFNTGSIGGPLRASNSTSSIASSVNSVGTNVGVPTGPLGGETHPNNISNVGYAGAPTGPAANVAANVAASVAPTQSPSNTVPRLRSVNSWSQLKPVVIKTPKTRRAKPDGGFMSPLVALTSYLPSTYSVCDPAFQYNQEKNPRRVLTEPNQPAHNNGYDNANHDYILYVNDILGTDENRKYLALNILGKGTFGQVVKCQNMATMEVVAVKVIKNKPTFLNQSMMEVSILEWIQQSVDKSDEHNLVRLKDKFTHKNHLCLVFDLLSSNLYEVIKKNKFRGLGIKVVRSFATQLLDSLAALKNAHLIHCDLKPENILLNRPDSLGIKVIDFGSACHERQTVYTYIQSRFYRSPEVILGLPYTSSIDMWSLGCIIAELFLGLPVFPGSSEYNQWCRIVESLGLPPAWMLDMGKNTSNCMDKLGPGQWVVRSIDEQNRLFNANEKEGKKYFASTNIHETIMSYPFPRRDMTPAEVKEELKEREALSDFVRGLLNYNPFERWTPHQAAMHPFISRQRFVGPYSPQVTSQMPSQVPSQVSPVQIPAVQHPTPQMHPMAPQVQPMAPPQMQQVPPMPSQFPQVQTTMPPSVAQPQVQQSVPFPGVHNSPQAFQYSHRAANSGSLQPPYQGFPGYGAPPATNRQRTTHNALRARSATIGQVNNSVPAPIQQAAALVDPNDVVQSHHTPAYFPPSNFYQR